MASADSLNPSGAVANGVDSYRVAIRGAAANPEALERIYQTARRTGASAAFTQAIAAAHQEAPDNLLLSAWYYRLHPPESANAAGRFMQTWLSIIPIGLVLGLALAVFSSPSPDFRANAPLLVFLAPPIVALAIILFLAMGGRRMLAQPLAVVALGAMIAYIFLLPNPLSDGRAVLILIHVPLLAWAAIGLAALGIRSTTGARFAFITKSIEAIGSGGVFGAAGVVFATVAIALFEVLGVHLPEEIFRLVVSLIVGLVLMFAVATVYDPARRPDQQEFARGLGWLLTVLMRVLLALSVVVLAMYVVAIPFNFTAPFENRSTLIIYNAMLFGVIAVLIGSVPVNSDGLSPRMQSLLRGAIIAVAALTALVSLYALAATVYRTSIYDFTMNRTTIIGWNLINIALLIALLVGQIRASRERWAASIHAVFAWGAIAYVIWAAVVGLALPWIFNA